MRFLLIFIALFLYAKEYSIQVCSSNKLDKMKKIYLKLKTYPNARIEKIGNDYVLRVGKSNSVKPLKTLLNKIKTEYKTAFIRDIKWDENRIVKVKNKKIVNKQEYSIQAYTSENLKMAITAYDRLKIYPYDRIEKIGDYYTVRIFRSDSVKNLRKVLYKVKKLYPRAFIRNIKWDVKRIIECNENLDNKEKQEVKIFNIFSVVEKDENKTKKRAVIVSDNNISKEVNVSKKVELPLYAKLSLELTKDNKPNIAKLLKQHDKLPVRDRVQAEINVGNVKQAYSDVYFNMKHDYSDYLSYKQARDLYMQYSNRLNILTKFNNLDKINTIDNNINLKVYIFNPYYLYIGNDFLISKNSNSSYQNIQTLDTDTKIGLEKLTNRGSLYGEIGYRKSYETFFEYLLKYNTIITKYISYEGKLGFNQKVEGETSYLLYAGKKDYLSNSLTFNLTNKESINLELDFNKFYSQDSVYLGNSIMEYIKYIRKLRVAYPDFSYYTYFKNDNYFQSSNRGDTKNISTIDNFDVLSKSYYETGVGFLFGWRHYDTYTKIWRPFIDTSIFYNSLTNVGINVFAGIGGSIYHQDNLSFGLNYSTPQNNISNYLEMLINYNLWF
jgi:hypothetical protein